MYKLEFTLKQHTPIIHFQHGQDGATLRATEVKPKLDRYLIEKLELVGNNGKPKAEYKSWFINDGKDHQSLDYKIRIESIGSTNCKDANYTENNQGKFRPNFPCIFGNVETKNEWHYLTWTNVIVLSIQCYDVKLKDKICTQINSFLLLNSFGFRQSKGFGSYYLIESSNHYIRPINKYHFSVDVSGIADDFTKYTKLFKVIDLFYKTLRSGINTSNFGGIYFKSLMFMYAKSERFHQQWDKRTIREHFYQDHPTYRDVKGRRINDSNGTVHYDKGRNGNMLFRDLMGLSTEQDWMNYGKMKKDKNGNSILNKGQVSYGTDLITKSALNGEIDRFKSPITFKPIKRENVDIYDVYLIPNSIPSDFLNKTFTVSSSTSNARNLNMTTPAEFILDDYLDFCFKTIFPNDGAFNAHVVNNTNVDAVTLRNIFNELRTC